MFGKRSVNKYCVVCGVIKQKYKGGFPDYNSPRHILNVDVAQTVVFLRL